MSAEPDSDTGLLSGLPSGTIEDKELALAFKAGDKGAYQAIHDRYSARVYSVCRRMLTHPHDAEEAAQETFLRTYQALNRFNGRYQLGAWITRIATNVCLDQLRARSRRPQHEAALELVDLENPSLVHEDGPEEIVLRSVESRRVRKILEGLPPMHRAAIVLRDFEGLSYDEVAIALGITDCQVKALIHRARQGFKRSWISAGLAALIPTRLFQRFRSFESIAKEPVASQALGSTAQAAPACTTALQQCGQYVAEKLAPVLTVALVGAAATGAVPSTASQPVGDQIAREDTSKVTTMLGLDEPASTQVGKTSRKKKRVQPVITEEPAPGPVVPQPTAAPEPTPADPEPSPTSAPPEEGTPGSQPDNSPSPSPTPQPFKVSVGFDRGTTIPRVLPLNQTTSVSCGTFGVRQHLETVIYDGAASYPATIDLVADAYDVSVYITIYKDGYEVFYQGPAYTSAYTRTGNNLHVTYQGTYGTDPDADKAGLPHSSTLWVDMRLDCAASSVVDEALVFGVSTPE
ncbi:MAG: sigma-70 family RNA polymerase sigma factor [Actinomycetota bacterium]